MIKTWSGNDSKISLHSTTPNFHSIASLHDSTPLHSTFYTCVTIWDWATSGTAVHNGTHWRLKYTSIHMFNQDSSPIWSLQDSIPIWSLQDSTPPLHLLADAAIIDILEKVHVQFCKLLLNLKTSTPIYIYGEIGRYPQNIHM